MSQIVKFRDGTQVEYVNGVKSYKNEIDCFVRVADADGETIAMLTLTDVEYTVDGPVA